MILNTPLIEYGAVTFKNFEARCPRVVQYVKYCLHVVMAETVSAVLQKSTRELLRTKVLGGLNDIDWGFTNNK